MSYRNDVDALAARKAALDAEVDARTKERDEAARMLAELHARAKLPVLPNIRIATPCTADWNAMTGDARVRHCASCDKEVFNLSAMTRAEAEALVVEKNANLCARYYQRKDGTILLADCEVGRAQQRRRLKLVGAGLFVTITTGVAVGAITNSDPVMELEGAISIAEPQRDQDITAIAGGIGLSPPPPPTTGIAECDSYRDAIFELAACDALGTQTRNTILDAYTKVQGAFEQVPPEGEGREALAKVCGEAAKLIRESTFDVCHPPVHRQAQVEPPAEPPVER